jgi:sugar phosphate isomerase/epimerase
MRRRDFVAAFAAGTAAHLTCTGENLLAKQTRRHVERYNPNDKRNRIAVSSWSFHNLFQSTREKQSALPGGVQALLDFPQMIADRYKVHNLEFVAPHFASREPAYMQELKLKLKAARSHLVNIPVDIPEIWNEGGLSDTDVRVRNAAINASKQWIDTASLLGARSVRCDPGRIKAEDLAPTLASYRQLASYGRSRGVAVIIENHGGVGSEHPEELIDLFRETGGNFIGALPDFGNFPDEETRMRGLRLLFPYAPTVCHAKGLEFDTAGNETKFDFKRCVQISREAHFKGVYSIEYEGPADPYEGVQRVVDELMRYL